jgi:hypothetical protein
MIESDSARGERHGDALFGKARQDALAQLALHRDLIFKSLHIQAE